jgi:hypothetical protein
MSADANQPYGIMTLDSPQRVEHVITPAGWFGLEIDHSLPGETRPITLRVTISKDQLLGLLAQLEATRQQFGFRCPQYFLSDKRANRVDHVASFFFN